MAEKKEPKEENLDRRFIRFVPRDTYGLTWHVAHLGRQRSVRSLVGRIASMEL